MLGKFSVYSIDSEKAPPPFTDPENWTVKVLISKYTTAFNNILGELNSILHRDRDEEIWESRAHLLIVRMAAKRSSPFDN